MGFEAQVTLRIVCDDCARSAVFVGSTIAACWREAYAAKWRHKRAGIGVHGRDMCFCKRCRGRRHGSIVVLDVDLRV